MATINDVVYSSQQQIYSRWASEKEIKSSLYEVNFNDDNPQYGGIPVFADNGSIYINSSDSHSLVIGATGSKKTRLIGMPALWSYAKAGESFIATDPKAELYERTLPMLEKQGYHVFILNLRDPLFSNGWNPLLVPYHLYHNGKRDKAIELVNDMSSCIAKAEYDRDPYWQNSAADLLAGLILILFECAQDSEINFKSLRTLRTQAFRIVMNGIPFIQENFIKHLDSSSFICSLLSGTVEVCDSTRGCIVSVFDQAVRPFFNQDNLINMLSSNDLDMTSIGKEKTAVFLLVPDENTLYHRLVSVFIKQCYTELILEAQKHPLKTLPHRVNFLLDEFSTLPQISDFPTMITASRSRNIRFNLIVQSINQLLDRYGRQAETIMGNCENLMFLHSREFSLLDNLSNLSGMRNHEEPLASVSMLQTLNKDIGETFVLYKRLHPFIASLPDIDCYPSISHEEVHISYPKNIQKALSVFDFKSFCRNNNSTFLSNLFSGKTLEEIREISNEEEEIFFMSNEDDEEDDDNDEYKTNFTMDWED